MKTLIVILVMCTTVAYGQEVRPKQSPQQMRDAISNAMDRIIIPSINMTNITMIDFANYLVDESKIRDSEHIGISIVVNMNRQEGESGIADLKRFTINEENLTYRELLNRACEQAECEWDQKVIPIVRPKRTNRVEQVVLPYVSPVARRLQEPIVAPE